MSKGDNKNKLYDGLVILNKRLSEGNEWFKGIYDKVTGLGIDNLSKNMGFVYKRFCIENNLKYDVEIEKEIIKQLKKELREVILKRFKVIFYKVLKENDIKVEDKNF